MLIATEKNLNTFSVILQLKMLGSPKSQKVGLRQVALKSDIVGENELLIPSTSGRKERETIGTRKHIILTYNPLELS